MFYVNDKFSMYRFIGRLSLSNNIMKNKKRRLKSIARYTSCYRSMTNHINHESITIYHEYASLKNGNRSMSISAYYTPNNYSFTDVVSHNNYCDDEPYFPPPKGHMVSKTLLQLDEINNGNNGKSILCL